MSQDRRLKRNVHALTEDGMILCNPRDREAAHRSQMEEGMASENDLLVTCIKCRHIRFKARRESTNKR